MASCVRGLRFVVVLVLSVFQVTFKDIVYARYLLWTVPAYFRLK